jgi:dTDP-4-dehydrorhamnose reductase
MRVLLFGKNGQVGWELQRTLAPLGEVVALGRQEADLGDFARLREVIRSNKPEVIVNAAAYTDVDGAESNRDLAMRVNGEAPGVLAEEAKKLGALLVYYSTDYVFDGKKEAPYRESDPTNPMNIYGESKLLGEGEITTSGGGYLILRTSWVYGLRKASFVTKVLNWAREKKAMRVVNDQTGSPTWCRLLAEATTQILIHLNSRDTVGIAESSGIYHLAGGGAATRFEWATRIVELSKRSQQPAVEPASSSEFPTTATRPKNSALNCEKIFSRFGISMPEWQNGLTLCMEELM